jgi:hypothetical protein
LRIAAEHDTVAVIGVAVLHNFDTIHQLPRAAVAVV